MKIITIISNYNEEKEILNTIKDFQENSSIKSDLLVIDNYSEDKSIKLIKESGVEYIQHPVNTGGGAGVIKTAFLYSYLMDYDIYCHMDGDNQHYASYLNKLIEPILYDKADIVIGSRFIEKKGFQSSLLRKIGIFSFSKLLSLLTKTELTDITSGFRAYNRKSINFFGKQYKHEFEVCVQMLLISHFAGLRILEIPVIMKRRITGKSEISFINGLKFPFYAIINLIGALLQKKQIRELSDAIIH